MFENIVMIQKDLHKDLKFDKIDTMAFAANISHIPVNVSEFYHVCKSQPILFIQNGENIASVALLGLKQDENLFLDKQNNWNKTEYCPIILRHYPFVYVQTGEVMSLGYDPLCKAVNHKKGNAIFDESGELTDLTKNILAAHDRFQHDMKITGAMIKKLQELKLLLPFNPEIRIEKNGYRFEGFLAIDEQKLNALSDKAKLDLHKLGYFSLIIAHLISLSNFNKLIALSIAGKE